MATDTIARGMAEGVVSQVSADRQAVSEDREVVEAAKTEVLNVAESIPEDYSKLSADVGELKEEFIELKNEIDDIKTTDSVVIPVTMEIGGINSSGANEGNEKRARTPGYLPTNPMIGTIHFPEGTEHRFGYYFTGTDVSVNSWSDWSSAIEDTIQ